jgi:hypothetical protein
LCRYMQWTKKAPKMAGATPIKMSEVEVAEKP